MNDAGPAIDVLQLQILLPEARCVMSKMTKRNNNLSNNVNASVIASVLERYQAVERALPLFDHFTDDKLECVYTVAHGYYMHRRFEEALDFFRFLTIYRLFDIRYLKAYAACQEMCGRLQEAIQCYELILVLADDDRETAMRHARCVQMLAKS